MVVHGHSECLKVLIEAGADVNIIDENNESALTCASWRGHSECVKLLLEGGVRINIANNYSKNALCSHISLIYPGKEICMLLNAAGEITDGTTIPATDVYGVVRQLLVSDYFLYEDLKLNLKHLCREAIRTHLINIDRHQHLFYRAGLGLPGSLSRYLLYDIVIKEPIKVAPSKDTEIQMSVGSDRNNSLCIV